MDRNTGARPDQIATIAEQRAAKAIADAKAADMEGMADELAARHSATAVAARDLSKGGSWDIGSKPNGSMYEVQINADPAHFLDWDKPLSEQGPNVQQALKRRATTANTARHRGSRRQMRTAISAFNSAAEAEAEAAR